MTKNDRWKTFREKVALVWNLIKYGCGRFIPETVIAILSLILLICAVVGACKGFSELAAGCSSVAVALLFALAFSIYSASKVFADRELLNIHARKMLSEKWSTDLDGIKMGSEDGAIYIVVITHVGYVFQVNTYDTRFDNQAEEMRSSLDFFRKYRNAKIHYIKAIDLLKLSIDAEEIRHELE